MTYLGCGDTLFAIKIGRRLVDEVDVGRGAQSHNNGHALKLSARQILHSVVDDAETL